MAALSLCLQLYVSKETLCVQNFNTIIDPTPGCQAGNGGVVYWSVTALEARRVILCYAQDPRCLQQPDALPSIASHGFCLPLTFGDLGVSQFTFGVLACPEGLLLRAALLLRLHVCATQSQLPANAGSRLVRQEVA